MLQSRMLQFSFNCPKVCITKNLILVSDRATKFSKMKLFIVHGVYNKVASIEEKNSINSYC